MTMMAVGEGGMKGNELGLGILEEGVLVSRGRLLGLETVSYARCIGRHGCSEFRRGT